MQPVIVIGAARSGTKFLRDLIGSSTVCRVVPYDVNYIWRYKNEGIAHDSFSGNDCTEVIAAHIRKQLIEASKQPKSDSSNSSFLIEKTVSNCLRIPFIERVFPEAIYLNLVRDGRSVVESSVRMWREPVNFSHLIQKARHFPLSNMSYATWYVKNLLGGWMTPGQGVKVWGVRYPKIEEDVGSLSIPEVCAKQWALCVEKSANDLATIPSDRVIDVRYEMLTSDDDEVRRICQLIGIPDGDRVLDHYRRENRPPNNSSWQPAFVGDDWTGAMEILLPTLSRLGYH